MFPKVERKPRNYSFWSKILGLYGLAWWKVKPIGYRSKRKKKKEAPREN